LERERTQAVIEKDEKVRAFKEKSARRINEELNTTLEQEQKLRGELEGQAEQLSAMITAQILRR
jgi:hypothetical protein